MSTAGSTSGQAITLANSIIGVGILAMPFCFKQCGIVLSILLIIISGFISRLACHFLLKSAIKSRRRNFEVLAFHVFGNPGKFAVEIGIIGFLMGTCIPYFVVVGDLGPQIVAKMFNINQSDELRTAVMVILAVICVLPLGLLKNVDSLSNVCAVTIGFYFCLVLKVIAEATTQIFAGEWMYKVEYWQPDGVLRCLPIFSMSLFCQTQLFEIYDTIPNASLEKMNYVTKNAVSICSAVYVLVGLFGYIGFCNQTISGNVLTNFSPTLVSDIIKLGFVMSLAFSFPLIIFPCRASLYSLLYKKGQVSPHDLLSNMIPDFRFKCITIGIIATTLLVSLMLPSIELVLGFIGSTIGVIICVIFPATCFICITIKNTNERMLAQVVLCFGIIIMVLGTYANLQAAEIDNIDLENKLPPNLDIKHDSFRESKLSPPIISDFNKEKPIVVSKEKLLHEEIPKYVINSKEIKESRLEPPNPVDPVEDNIDNPPPKLIEPIKKPDKLENLEALNRDTKEGAGDNEVQIGVPSEKKTKAGIEEQKEMDEKKIDEQREKELDEIKKKDLIDTIKKHEEEQRQIMNEQKEMLKEMKKTKEELEQESLLKKGESESRTSAENKKLAMENIQKLAKIAIESLGGKLDIITEKSLQKPTAEDQLVKGSLSNKSDQLIAQTQLKQLSNVINKIHDDTKKEFQDQPKIENKHETKQTTLGTEPHIDHNKDIKNKNETAINRPYLENVHKIHAHKADEPESYKAGENIQLEKNEITYKKENSMKNINKPIALALSELNKKETFQKENEVLKKGIVEGHKKINNDVKIENENDEYVGGKRDILEIHRETNSPFYEKAKKNLHFKLSEI